MNSFRLVLSIVLIALGCIAAILPDQYRRAATLSERELQEEMKLKTYYLDVDQLADLLIQQDPSIRLIDLRDAAAYGDKTLPGALNIPADSVLSPNWLGYFDQAARKNVLFSQGDELSLETWKQLRRQGFPEVYLLEGGLDAWQAHILDPQAPPVTAPAAAQALYQQRVAAKQYFTGEKVKKVAPAAPAVPIQRRKKKMVQGGCS